MDYIKGFEANLRNKERSDNTVSCYLRDTLAFMAWYRTKTEYGLEKLIKLDCIDYKKQLLRSNQKVITINRKIASLNVFFKWMHDMDCLKEHLHIDTVRSKIARQYKGLEDTDIWKLRNEIHRSDNKNHICMIEILLGTGVRVSELVSIRLRDIELSDRKGSLTIIGKGNAERMLPINKDVRKAIVSYLVVRPNSECEYLFIGQRGAYDRNAINLILKKYGDRVKVEVTPHKLRHTLGYHLVRQMTPLTTIQQILGHDHIATTNLYTMTTEKDMREALEQLEW